MDLDGDGIDEWIVPVPSGYEIRTPAAAVCTVACDVVSEMRPGDSVYITHRLPACHTFDVPGDTQKGLAFLSDQFADFAYGSRWSKTARFKIPVNLDEKWEASTKMEDINRDGLPDLIVTQTRGTINLEAQTHVYLATAPFTYPAAPTATFATRGAVAGASLIDVDGDGNTDMVFVSMPFGARNIINFFTRRKLSVHVEVYPFNNGAFSAKPVFAENFLLDAPEGRERVAYTFGDFNGDGRIDATFGSGSDKLEIHTGAEDRLMSAKPWVAINVPTFGIANAYNLDGGNGDDLVIYHSGGKNSKRVDVLVFE